MEAWEGSQLRLRDKQMKMSWGRLWVLGWCCAWRLCPTDSANQTDVVPVDANVTNALQPEMPPPPPKSDDDTPALVDDWWTTRQPIALLPPPLPSTPVDLDEDYCMARDSTYNRMDCLADMLTLRMGRMGDVANAVCAGQAYVNEGFIPQCQLLAFKAGQRGMEIAAQSAMKDRLTAVFEACQYTSRCHKGCIYGAATRYVHYVHQHMGPQHKEFNSAIFSVCEQYVEPDLPLNVQASDCPEAMGRGLMFKDRVRMRMVSIDEALAVCYQWRRPDGEVDQSSAEQCKKGAIAQYVARTLAPLKGLHPTAQLDTVQADWEVVRNICAHFHVGPAGSFYYSPQGECAFQVGLTVMYLSSFNANLTEAFCNVMPREPSVARCREGLIWTIDDFGDEKLALLVCKSPPPPVESLINKLPPASPSPPSSPPVLPAPPSSPSSPPTQLPAPNVEPEPALLGTCKFATHERVGADGGLTFDEADGTSNTLGRVKIFTPFCGDLLPYPILEPLAAAEQPELSILKVDERLVLKYSAFMLRLKHMIEGAMPLGAGADADVAVLSSHCKAALREKYCRASFAICSPALPSTGLTPSAGVHATGYNFCNASTISSKDPLLCKYEKTLTVCGPLQQTTCVQVDQSSCPELYAIASSPESDRCSALEPASSTSCFIEVLDKEKRPAFYQLTQEAEQIMLWAETPTTVVPSPPSPPPLPPSPPLPNESIIHTQVGVALEAAETNDGIVSQAEQNRKKLHEVEVVMICLGAILPMMIAASFGIYRLYRNRRRLSRGIDNKWIIFTDDVHHDL